jgi:rhomboid family GlyGly-CTERM serine protease
MGLELTRIISGLSSFTRNTDWRLPAILCLLVVIPGLLGGTATEFLRFDRNGIEAGELWRLFSGHLVHLGWPHLVLNLAGLLLVWLLAGDQYSLKQWMIVLVGSVAGVSLGLWYLDPALEWYVGLSGVLHGLLIAGLIPGVRALSGESLTIAIVVIGKLAYEQLAGPLPGSEATAGGAVVVNAHLYGALGGVLAALLVQRRVRPDAPI